MFTGVFLNIGCIIFLVHPYAAKKEFLIYAYFKPYAYNNTKIFDTFLVDPPCFIYVTHPQRLKAAVRRRTIYIGDFYNKYCARQKEEEGTSKNNRHERHRENIRNIS